MAACRAYKLRKELYFMGEKKPVIIDEKISDELKRVIQIFSKTASDITSNIEEAIKIANSEEELVEILKETLKNTKENLTSLMETLEHDK
jgi:predicted DNA-binding antitoxin AbrB/MazE fold protein